MESFEQPPIKSFEKEFSKEIRKALEEKRFDDLYKFLPKEIARKINEKYRIIEIKPI